MGSLHLLPEWGHYFFTPKEFLRNKLRCLFCFLLLSALDLSRDLRTRARAEIIWKTHN